MKVLFLGGQGSKELFNWLTEQGEEVFYTEDKITVEGLNKLRPDIIVSYNYRYIIKKEIIDFVKGNAVNLHISYLPYNKGAHPNVWSFLEDTPKGVTIHCIDEGIDTGKIIVQKEVAIDEDRETLKSSYEFLHAEMRSLFKETWDQIKSGAIMPRDQEGHGTLHFMRDFVKIEPLIKEKGWDTPISELKRRYAVITALSTAK